MSTFSTCTSSTRPDPANDGNVLFETDTKNIIIWDGSNWKGYANDGNSIPVISNSFSAEFNGSSDYLDVGQISTLTGASAQTVSMWFKGATTSDYPAWGNRTDSFNQFSGRYYGGAVGTTGYYFDVRNGPSVTASEYSYIVETANLPSDTNWHHYVFVFNAGSFAIYVDGVEKTGIDAPGKTPPTTLSSTAANLHVSRAGGTSIYSEGSFDEFAIWDVALDASNAAQLYNLGRPFDLSTNAGNYNKSTDLTNWYRMGDDASDTDSGGGSPTSGDTIGNVENAANNNTNDASVGGGAPTYSSSTPPN